MPVAWGMSHDFYQALLAPLELPLKFAYFDPLGTRRSGPLPADWQPLSIVEEADSVRESLGEEQVIVAGHASGAFLALAYALRYPERVKGVILINPYASYDRVNEAGSMLLEQNPYWRRFNDRVQEIRRVRLSSSERFRAIYKEQRVVDLWDYGIYYFEMADAADMASFNPAMHDDYERDLLPDLGRIQAPTLILTGVHDALAPLEESVLIAENLPFVRLIEFQQSRHFPFVEEAEKFTEAISAFLRDTDLAAPNSPEQTDA
jgi:proline iminopeptidase